MLGERSVECLIWVNEDMVGAMPWSRRLFTSAGSPYMTSAGPTVIGMSPAMSDLLRLLCRGIARVNHVDVTARRAGDWHALLLGRRLQRALERLALHRALAALGRKAL